MAAPIGWETTADYAANRHPPRERDLEAAGEPRPVPLRSRTRRYRRLTRSVSGRDTDRRAVAPPIQPEVTISRALDAPRPRSTRVSGGGLEAGDCDGDRPEQQRNRAGHRRVTDRRRCHRCREERSEHNAASFAQLRGEPHRRRPDRRRRAAPVRQPCKPRQRPCLNLPAGCRGRQYRFATDPPGRARDRAEASGPPRAAASLNANGRFAACVAMLTPEEIARRLKCVEEALASSSASDRPLVGHDLRGAATKDASRRSRSRSPPRWCDGRIGVSLPVQLRCLALASCVPLDAGEQGS